MNNNWYGLRYLFRTILRVAILFVVGIGSTSTHSATKFPDVIALLSEGKAKAEGRASRAQACLSKKNPKILASLISKYDDARNSFNGRIDGLVAAIKFHRQKETEKFFEVESLNHALNLVDAFAEAADKVLVRYGCGVYKKIFWGKVVAVLLTPEMFRLLWDFFSNATTSEKEREEIIQSIQVQKIVQWQDVRAIIVFDWQSAKYFTATDITAKVISRGSTSIYVNEWALEARPKYVLDFKKTLPIGLSHSYKFYAGSVEELLNLESGVTDY